MPKGAWKGSDFEREICKLLSKWWTGWKRDDVFWRASQSGGRATQRMKVGLKTHGSYGDIAALDPIGEPLLKLVTLELKRGNSCGSPGELVDALPQKAMVVRPFESALLQAERSKEAAGSVGWMLIVRRDRRESMVYMDTPVIRFMEWEWVFSAPFVRYRLLVNQKDDFPVTIDFAGVPLWLFLRSIKPQEIIRAVRHLQGIKNS